MRGQIVRLDAKREIDETGACVEKTDRLGERIRAASLMVIDAGNSLGTEKAVWKTVVKLFWKSKG